MMIPNIFEIANIGYETEIIKIYAVNFIDELFYDTNYIRTNFCLKFRMKKPHIQKYVLRKIFTEPIFLLSE